MQGPSPRPLVGIPACRREIEPHYFHVVGEKYVLAVADGAQALPWCISPIGDRLDLDELIERLDGLLLTGAPSNLEPRHFGGDAGSALPPHDPARDATTLPLIRRAVAAGVPMLAVCRGLQEVNVAYGGTLHQRVHEVAGMLDHREDKSLPLEARYAPVHEVELEPGGVLAELAGSDRVRVNSLHSQGVDRLGEGLAVEGLAPDGLVEAVRVEDAPAFALAVQWHPEWRVTENPFSLALFRAFGEAARVRRASR